MSLYLWQTHSAVHSWWSLFYHTFVVNVANFNSFDEAFQFSTYRFVLEREFATLYSGTLRIQTNLPLFLLLSMFLLFSSGKGRLRLRLFALAFQANVLITFCLFPSVLSFDRLLAPLYILIAIFVLIAISPDRGSQGQNHAGDQSLGQSSEH